MLSSYKTKTATFECFGEKKLPALTGVPWIVIDYIVIL